MNTAEKAYKEILKVLTKYRAEIVFDVASLETQARHHLFGIKLVEKYGFELDPKKINNTDWQKLREGIAIGFWDGERRKISCSDDGSQPDKEDLLCISYPTGAYIFGDDYPTELFQALFLELKTYKPKYVDTKNSSLYYSLANAGRVYNDYDSIITRYHEENKAASKQRNINKLKRDLAALEARA